MRPSEVRSFSPTARRLPPGMHGIPAAAERPSTGFTRRQFGLAAVNVAAILALDPAALARTLQQAPQVRPAQTPKPAAPVAQPHLLLPTELWGGKLGDVKEALAADPLFIDDRSALIVTHLYRHPTTPDQEAFGPNDRYKFRFYEIDFTTGGIDFGPAETGLFTKSPFPGTSSGILKLGALFEDPQNASAAIFLHRTAAGFNGLTGQRYTLGGSFTQLSPAQTLTYAQPFWSPQNGRYELPTFGEYSEGFTFNGNHSSVYSYFDDPTPPPSTQDKLQLLGPGQKVLWSGDFTPYYPQVYGEQPTYYLTPNQKLLLAVHRSGMMSGIARNSY